MRPLPQTSDALEALAAATDGTDAARLEKFDRAATITRRIVPQCVGLTLTFVEDGVSFTWVATDLDYAALDAIQYLGGGPCITAEQLGAVATHSADDPIDERVWLAFAKASARAGVASTLSIPLMSSGGVYGAVNLYGSTPTAFEGHHEELAALYAGRGDGADTNKDPAFTTPARAKTAPRVLADAASSRVALGLIMAARRVSEPAARRLLGEAAARAGVPVRQVAEILLDTELL